jgi:hypothetical protein
MNQTTGYELLIPPQVRNQLRCGRTLWKLEKVNNIVMDVTNTNPTGQELAALWVDAVRSKKQEATVRHHCY